MSIFTMRELEFLASLKTSWRRLYWNELARLLSEDDNRGDISTKPLSSSRHLEARNA
jgi:hypothetical protein